MLAIYTRLSREDEDSNSIKNQIKEGRLFAKENNLTNYRIYDEGEGISGGADVKDRPELFALLQDIRKGNLTHVWFRNQNRLDRNTGTYAIFINESKKFNIKVYFGDKLFDYSNPQDNLFGIIQSAVNQYTKDLQGVQTKKQLHLRVKEGKTQGIIPYGYTKDDADYLIIDEDESKVVKQMYDLSLKGIGTEKIAEILNDNQVPTRYKKLSQSNDSKTTYKITDIHTNKKTVKQKSSVEWKGGTVRGIIKNTIYKGKRLYQKSYIDAPNLAIIKPSYWKEVNDNFKENRNNSGTTVKYNYLLRGLIVCGKCGKYYVGRKRKSKKDNFYACGSKRNKKTNCGSRAINIDVIENFIWQRFFADKELKAKVIEHFGNLNAKEELKFKQEELKKYNKDLSKNKEERKKTTEGYVKGILKEKDVAISLNRLEREEEGIMHQINNLADEIEQLKDIKQNTNRIIKELDKVKANSKFNKRQELVKKYITKIHLMSNSTNNIYGIIVVLNFGKKEGYFMVKNHKNEFIATEIKSGLTLSNTDKNYSSKVGSRVINKILKKST